MTSINHLIRIDASVTQVFQALTSNEGIAKWFAETQCKDWKTGSTVTWFGSIDMKINELIEDKLVQFHVNSGGGWDNTDIRFSVEDDSGKSVVRFDHSNWSKVSDHFRDCSMSWAYFLESLRQYLETGVGTPEGFAPACESE